MDNKKKFAAICIGFLILSASVGTTLAYLGNKDEKPNRIEISIKQNDAGPYTVFNRNIG